jgi:hypothetical protein
MIMVSNKEQESIGHVVSGSSSEAGLTLIEQLQIVASKNCTNPDTPYMIGVNESEQKIILSKAACKMWNCETCAARNARRWIACVIIGINETGGQWYLLTLTSHRYHRKEKSIGNIRAGFKLFYNKLRDTLGEEFKNFLYVKVWEQHTDGSFHLHLIVNRGFKKWKVKKWAAEAGMGYQADIREIEHAGMAAGYIAKYTLKNASIARGGVLWPKSLRRVEKSRNWPNLPQKEANLDWGWLIAENRQYQLSRSDGFFVRGFEVIDLTS